MSHSSCWWDQQKNLGENKRARINSYRVFNRPTMKGSLAGNQEKVDGRYTKYVTLHKNLESRSIPFIIWLGLFPARGQILWRRSWGVSCRVSCPRVVQPKPYPSSLSSWASLSLSAGKLVIARWVRAVPFKKLRVGMSYVLGNFPNGQITPNPMTHPCLAIVLWTSHTNIWQLSVSFCLVQYIILTGMF